MPNVLIFNKPNEIKIVHSFPLIVFSYFASCSKWRYYNLKGEFITADNCWFKPNTFYYIDKLVNLRGDTPQYKLPIKVYFHKYFEEEVPSLCFGVA